MLQNEPELVGVHLVVGLGVCNNFNTLDSLPMHRFFCALIAMCAGNIEWHAHNGLVHTLSFTINGCF